MTKKKGKRKLKYVYLVVSIEQGKDGSIIDHGVTHVFDNKEAAIETARRMACFSSGSSTIELEISEELQDYWIECRCRFEGKLYSEVHKINLDSEPDDDWEPLVL